MATIEAPRVAWPLHTDWPPRAYQLDALERLTTADQVLDHGLGAGKTTTTLAALETLGTMRVLVLCPNRVVAVWPNEVAENAAREWVVWAGKVQGARGPLKNPSVARRCEALIQANADAIRLGRPFMAVVNYEATNQQAMANLLTGTAWDAFVCDESHKLAGAGAKTSMLTKQIGIRVRQRGGRIILCTGTFMPHTALSVYGQMRTLDTTVLGTSWTAFKARYAAWRVLRERNQCPKCHRQFNRLAGTGCPVLCKGDDGRIALLAAVEPVYHLTPRGDRIPDGVKPDTEHELMERIGPHVHRVSQAELDAQTGLVETAPQLRTCTLRPATRTVYDALERDMIARVGDGTITAANAMVAVTRLAQATSGYGVDAGDPSGKTHISLTPGHLPEKATLLADILDDEIPDVREPIVIFARFHHDLNMIRQVCEKQGRRYGEISGRRDDGLDGHRMASGIDVVGVQPQAGGAGISLTRAAICIFYTSDWSLANFDQAKRRVLRQGQTRHVVYLFLVAENTIDESLFYAIKKRRETNDAVLARLTRGTAR